MKYYYHFDFKTTDTEVYKTAFKNAVTLFTLCRKYFPTDFELYGTDGTNKPIINNDTIQFNGDKSLNLDGTPFIIDISVNFGMTCETDNKPYDIAVCCALLCLKEMFGIEFNYDSDTNGMTNYDKCSKEEKKDFCFNENWERALIIFKQALNDMFIEEYHSEVFNKKLKYLPKKKVI